jgi:AAA ATPase domain
VRHVERCLTKSKVRAIQADTFRDVDPVRNPYAPGAGQRPPELAGRDTELAAFDVALERVERGRPERSLVLTGLRGVGKTVLLNALRSKALDRGWGTGKVEARPDTSLRRPLTGALHAAVRELSVRHRAPDRVREVLATLKAFGLRSNPRGGKLIERWTPAIDGPPSIGRADSGDMEIDLLELLTDVAGIAADVGVGVAVFIDEMQDLTPTDVSALCASCHELSQTGAPLMVVGAGLPHLPSVLSASKSYSERLFRYVRIDRLDSAGVQRALLAPAEREGATWAADALAAMGVTSGGYPYFVQAYGKAAWDHAPGSPITAADVTVAAPEAEAELAVGFFGSRYERATPSERDYLRAMAGLTTENTPDAAVSTTDVADVLGRKPSSLSPARDALLKKGLVYSAERGTLAFTVPHFARWLRTHPPA